MSSLKESTKRMELLQLTYFLAAAKTENFSQVARLYNVPTSTVSKSISMLEKELGVKLFNRQSNKLTLNDLGLKFSEHISIGLDSISKGILSLKNHTVNNEISLLVLCARNIVTEFIGEYKIKHPNINFKINHNINSDFTEYDLCICDLCSVPKTFNTITLFKENYGIAANKNSYNLSTPIDLAELANEKFIMMYKDAVITKDIIRFCEKYGFEPKTDIVCEDPLYVRQYVEIGLGITFTPMKSWNNLFSEKISIIDFHDETIQREVVFCFQKSQNSDLSNQFIKDFCNYTANL